ncbi:GroES-like protein [Neoconidiobolus thromboides FSU 785]|nr:GroES-like protein [Neoconidiobolus thromboides FSU 785]
MDLINAWASHGKNEKLQKFTYEAALLLDDDIEVEITHCGICGSDIHTLDSGWGPTEYPVIVGHEIIGKVSKLGSKVTKFQLGDRVGIGAQCEACLKPECYECNLKQENMCPDAIWTYNNRRKRDGAKAYGGYAEKVRVQHNFAFKLPNSIPSDYAAPLLCAGTTVFTPMLRYKLKAGDNVGIVGIGGLGHLAIMFANKLGCNVTAISRSNKKQEEAIGYGASNFIATDDPEQVAKGSRTLNYLIVTACAEDANWEMYCSWMKLEGRIILLGIPEANLSIPPFALLLKNLSVTGSLIGSINEIEHMLQFAANHNIRPVIERFPMSEVNNAVQYVRDNKVRYRVVLEN